MVDNNGSGECITSTGGVGVGSGTSGILILRSHDSPNLNGILSNNCSHDGSNSGHSTPSLGAGSVMSSTDSILKTSGSDAKLFVGGLSWQTTPERLRDYFTQFGTVVDVLVMKDPVTQRSRGFGFVTFTDCISVSRVLSVPEHTLDGKRIDPKPATPRSKSGLGKTKKVFVGGVSQDTSVDEIKLYFSQFGKVDEALMLMDQQTKRHRGFGFVTFEMEDVVDRICEIHYHIIKGKKVECKRAQPKETVASLNALAKRMILPISPGSPTTLASPASLGGFATLPPIAAAVANYSKILNHHALGNVRYSPYGLPCVTSNPLTTLSAHAYGAYSSNPLRAPIDMSSLRNLDWTSVYNAYV